MRIAQGQVEPCGGRPFGIVPCLAIPVGAFLSFFTRDGEVVGCAIVWFGSIWIGVFLAMPFCADHLRLRIIRTLHEVQLAAEK